MQLTTMHDIGGCRAVLSSVDEVRRVRRRWLQTGGRVIREYNYLDNPKSSGYRGVHLVVQYDGYPIEVQLRTQLQHAWGVGIEKVGPKIGYDLKSGEGPAEVLRLFAVFGELLADVEGLPADLDVDELTAAINAAPPEILPMIGLSLTGGGINLELPAY